MTPDDKLSLTDELRLALATEEGRASLRRAYQVIRDIVRRLEEQEREEERESEEEGQAA